MRLHEFRCQCGVHGEEVRLGILLRDLRDEEGIAATDVQNVRAGVELNKFADDALDRLQPRQFPRMPIFQRDNALL